MFSLTQHLCFFLPLVLTGSAQIRGGMNAEAGQTCLSSESEPILSAVGVWFKSRQNIASIIGEVTVYVGN